jgi:hypothetical protein
MPKDDRDVLEVLKFELRFVQQGGYGRSPHAPWRAPLVFEDSPTCMNYYARGDCAPCSECLMMQFVPAERQGEKIPCRHIPLDAEGRTLEAFYAQGTQPEIEEALEAWLKATIHRLEQERTKAEGAPADVSAPAN